MSRIKDGLGDGNYMQKILGYAIGTVSILSLLTGCEPSKPDINSAPNAKASDVSSCLICDDLESLKTAISSPAGESELKDHLKTYTSNLETNFDYAKPLKVNFNIHDFCNAQNVQDILSLPDIYIPKYDAAVGKIQACPSDCNIKINEAEYCEFGNMMTFQTQAFPVLSDAFQNASILLGTSDQSNQSVTYQLDILLSGAVGDAQSSLKENLRSLLGGPVEGENPALAVATAELHDTGLALQAFSWAGLVGDNGLAHGNKVVHLSKSIKMIDNDVHLAMTRAKLLEPDERETLAQRVLDAYVELTFIRESISVSASSETPSKPKTNANAINSNAENSVALQAAAACFDRLALETSVLPTMAEVVMDEFETCRTFTDCNLTTLDMTNSDLKNVIDRVVSNVDKDQKLMFLVSNGICQ